MYVCVCVCLCQYHFLHEIGYCLYRSIRVHIRADSVFTRGEGELEERVPAFFDVDSTRHLDVNELIADLDSRVDNWNGRGSAYSIDHITRFTIISTKYRPLCGSTYIPTPQWLANKQAAINVKNSDNRCFVWSILWAMFPAPYHPDRITHYKAHENVINTTGLTFPLDVHNVLKFEALNLTISVNVLCTGDEGGYVPLHMSNYRNRTHQINLFLLWGKDEQRHYEHDNIMSESRTCHVSWQVEQMPRQRHLCVSPASIRFQVKQYWKITHQTASDIPHNMCTSPTRKKNKRMYR